MRNLFIVGCKLIGLVCLFQGVAALTDLILVYITAQQRVVETTIGEPPLIRYYRFQICETVVSFIAATILLCASKALSRLVKVPEDDNFSLAELSPSLLQVGMIIFGLYLVQASLSDAISHLLSVSPMSNFWDMNMFGHGIGYIVQFLFGVALLLFSKVFSSFFIKDLSKLILKKTP